VLLLQLLCSVFVVAISWTLYLEVVANESFGSCWNRIFMGWMIFMTSQVRNISTLRSKWQLNTAVLEQSATTDNLLTK